jgi:tRNA acetyltransferase TAN1
MCGDKYPIISGIKYPGLITALTNIDSKEVIYKIKKIIENDSNFFQFILKIIPIDYVCETNIKIIKEFVDKYYRIYINEDQSFKIDLIRRKNELVERDTAIESIAKIVNNKVNLDNPDKIIRIEILGNVTGICFLNPDDLIRINSKFNRL